jgi:hypothetical protein
MKSLDAEVVGVEPNSFTEDLLPDTEADVLIGHRERQRAGAEWAVDDLGGDVARTGIDAVDGEVLRAGRLVNPGLETQAPHPDGLPRVEPGRRVSRSEPFSSFDSRHRPRNAVADLLRINDGAAGASGRRTLALADWDGNARTDLVVDSRNANVLRNERMADGITAFRDSGPVADRVLAGHSTCPTVGDRDRDGVPELVIGAEDGGLYYRKDRRRVSD